MSNQISVAGNVGGTPELKAMQGGDMVLSFSLADNQKIKGEEKVQWFRCALFGKRAEALAPHIKSGSTLTVWGTLNVREYEGKNGKGTSLDLRVSEIALQGGKRDANTAPYGTSGHGANAKHTAPPEKDVGQGWDNGDF